MGARTRGLLLVLVGACAWPGGSVSGQVATSANPKKVLALHIVRRDLPSLDDTLRAALMEGLSGRVDYYSEYIDLNRLSEPKYQSALLSYIRTRYVDDAFDLVIASGPSVVEFLNHDPSLRDLPVVYTTRAGLAGGPRSTGIVSVVDLAGTLSVALDLQPNTKHVFVVSGEGRFDQIYADLFKEQRVPFAKRVTFHDLVGLSLPDLERRVARLPPDSIVYFLSLSDDGAGRRLLPLDALDPIVAAANAPVYSWHDNAMGRGIVGGRLHSSTNDASEMARIALRVLRGEAPETIPVVSVESYTYQFDWRQLQRWNIDEARLPAGDIHFRQLSFLEQYWSYVIGGGLVFAAQLALISGLLIQRSRRRRAERALRTSETQTSAILRAIPDLMFVMDRKGTIVDYHARDSSLLFVPPEAFMGRTVSDVLPPQQAEIIARSLEQAHESGEPVVVEYELALDETRYFECRLVPVDNGRVLSIIRDVTEPKRALDLNRVLAGRLIVSQEEERQRIARDLHDDLSQKIAVLNIEVDQIAAEVQERAHRARLQRVSSQVDGIARDLHHLSHELHPSRLHTMGLVESVRSLCLEISQQGDLNVVFSESGLPRVVDPSVSLCLYRITQEALHNVAKHSRAREASVRLTLEGSDIHLEIADTGIGFNPTTVDQAGLGLVSMRERVGILKGQIVIDAVRGGGTRVGVRIPLTPPARDAQSISRPA